MPLRIDCRDHLRRWATTNACLSKHVYKGYQVYLRELTAENNRAADRRRKGRGASRK
jgi:hypothetical protein